MTHDLSFHDIVKMFRSLFPPLYYATEESIERGEMYYMKATKFTPECVACHPDDLEKIKAIIGRPLVHLREWKPSLVVDFDPRPLPRPGPQPTPPIPDPWPGPSPRPPE